MKSKQGSYNNCASGCLATYKLLLLHPARRPQGESKKKINPTLILCNRRIEPEIPGSKYNIFAIRPDAQLRYYIFSIVEIMLRINCVIPYVQFFFLIWCLYLVFNVTLPKKRKKEELNVIVVIFDFIQLKLYTFKANWVFDQK